MTVHKLKCLDPFFDAVKRGEKTFEVRRDDRGLNRGDTVVLLRVGKTQFYENAYKRSVNDSGGCSRDEAESIERRIGWVLTGGQFGIEPGYVVFSLEETEGKR